MPISDKYGRAFEYCVTEFILSKLEKLYPKKVKITARARKAQLQGEKQFKSLVDKRKKQFKKSGEKIAEWLVEKRFKKIGEMKFEKPTGTLTGFIIKKPSSSNIDNVEVDRIPDIAGVKGDVTDIRIKFFSKDGVATINVSLKHRHEALKHPRLTRVPGWVGLTKTKEAKQYIKDYEEVWSTFFEMGKKLLPHAKRFRELKAKDSSFISKNLYKPLYVLVKDFLEKNTNNTSQVQQLFDFIVGKFDYVKFIDHDGKIELREFSNITKPNSVKIEYEEDGYIYFEFDNGLKISGRLHTATEWLKKSIKFDMQPVNLDSLVPAVYI